jgi:mannose/fructose/N-acetylgalactosamine-specific phosphotransferase system component IIC
MLETVINDVAGIFRGTFLGGDWIALIIAFGSVLVASLLMRRGTQIGSMTLLALVLFALGGYLRGYFRGPSAAQVSYGDRAVSQLEASWGSFMNLQAGTLLAYFIAFMVLIFVLFGVRSVLGRS